MELRNQRRGAASGSIGATVESSKANPDDRVAPLAAFEALAWLCANHPDRALRECAYRLSVALEWKGDDAGMLDTVTLQNWQEKGASTDLEEAATRFVEAVEETLFKQITGRLRSGTLRGLGALGIGKLSRDDRKARLLAAEDGAPDLQCYAGYVRDRAAGRSRRNSAAALAICLRRAGSDD